MPVNAAEPGKALLGGGMAPQPRAAGAGQAEGGWSGLWVGLVLGAEDQPFAAGHCLHGGKAQTTSECPTLHTVSDWSVQSHGEGSRTARQTRGQELSSFT